MWPENFIPNKRSCILDALEWRNMVTLVFLQSTSGRRQKLPPNGTRMDSGELDNVSGVISCEEKQCPPPSTCVLGSVLCPFGSIPICLLYPTECIRTDGTVQIDMSGDEAWDAIGDYPEGSGGCPTNMYSSTCGFICPRECREEQACFDIVCSDVERCFCNSGHIPLNTSDLSVGCTPGECSSSTNRTITI
ncbi:unnamed protein product [Cylicocyclus nassatus]|uniref:TIL domain-containing protein n=1 Tax=Cylicocyclus nassatus TaxID=53992 RepID=A0AA36DN80_CYLNA|nr:unnamed protein product [Cylicocyclus nassatus]